MKRLKKFMVASSLVLIGCNCFATIELPNTYVYTANRLKKLKSVLKAQNLKPYVVGGTYDSMSQHPTNATTCLVAGNNINNLMILNPHASLDFSQEQTLQSIQKALGINISATIGFGPFSVSASYNYGKSSQDDAYTLNLNYIYQYAGTVTFKNNILVQGEEALTPAAREIVNSSPVAFRQMCGDNVVSALDAGASVLMRLTLKFNSSVEKNYYEEGLKELGGLQGILSKIEQNPHGVHYTLTADGIQIGGNPALFNQLFAQYGGKPNVDGYLSLECGSNNNINHNCGQLINQVITYATSIGKQLNSPADYYTTNPTLSKWSSIGIHPGDAGINPKITDAMQQLTQQYYADSENLQFINDYQRMLASKQRLSNLMQSQLNQLASKYQTILSMYRDPDYHLMDCFNGFVSTRCLTIRDNVFNTRQQILSDAGLNDILTYLRTNQYSVGLAITPNLSTNSQCLLSPITTADAHLYMLNCNGQAFGSFDNASGISISKTPDKMKMIMNNLNYQYSETGHTTSFSYQFEQPLSIDSFYGNVYSEIARVNSKEGGHETSSSTNVLFTNLN